MGPTSHLNPGSREADAFERKRGMALRRVQGGLSRYPRARHWLRALWERSAYEYDAPAGLSLRSKLFLQDMSAAGAPDRQMLYRA